MQRFMLKSKIHRATVTDADLHYEGSISIDEKLMEEANMICYEQVEIYDVNNGERFSNPLPEKFSFCKFANGNKK